MRLMPPGLYHTRPGLKDAEFFSMIDQNGGWPLGYRYVGFCHTDKREAGFTNSGLNTGWWTVIADADDYYMWKLTPAALKRISDSVIYQFLDSIHWHRLDAMRLNITGSKGYPAALSNKNNT